MNSSFKTPELYDWLLYLQEMFPEQKSVVSAYIPKFANIDLSIYNNIQLQETYLQSITFPTGGIVYIVWNIDSIIYKIKNTKNIPIYSIPIKTIINDKEILYEDFDSILSDINQDLKIGFPHKLDSIIIGELPNLCQKTVIDGNHRLLEAYIAGSKNISCYYILPQDAIQFLQKDSQLFILLADQLFKAIL